MTEDTTAPAAAAALPAADPTPAAPAAPGPEVAPPPVPPTAAEIRAYFDQVAAQLDELKAHLEIAVGKVETAPEFGHQAHAFLKNAETLAGDGIAWVKRHL